MGRFREFLSWRLGEFAFFALPGGFNLGEGLIEGRLHDVFNGLGLILLGSFYLLRPVKIDLNFFTQPIGKSLSQSRSFARGATIGSPGLGLVQMGLFWACIATSVVCRFYQA